VVAESVSDNGDSGLALFIGELSGAPEIWPNLSR